MMDEEEQALRVGYNIRRTLFRFEIEDLKIQRRLKLLDEPDKEMAGGSSLPLSEACGIYHISVGVLRKAYLLDPDILIYRGDKKIGHVDQEGCFHYTEAPDLRTGLGWALATGFFGKEMVLSKRNLEKALESVKNAASFQELANQMGRSSAMRDFDHHRELYELITKLEERERRST